MGKRLRRLDFNFSPYLWLHLAVRHPKQSTRSLLLLPGDGGALPLALSACPPASTRPVCTERERQKKMGGDRNSCASQAVGGGKCHLLSRRGEMNSRWGRAGVRAASQVMGVARVHSTGAELLPVD